MLDRPLRGVHFGNRRFALASVHGTKWLDRDGDGQRDPDDRGIPGVTIYSDVDMDGRFSPWEPHTVTMSDDPDTRLNEAGHYWLENLQPGGHVIREVIPDGFVQTFPLFDFPIEPGIGEDGQPIDDFPIPPPNDNGGHWVWLEVGGRREAVDFGNRPIAESATILGRKWLDRDGNGRRDDGEPGLPGVRIYDDANLNNRFDRGEPTAITRRDDPNTPFNESGLYRLEGVEPGLALIREVVPDGFEQTFPEILLCEATFCVGRAHMLSLEPGQVVDGVHFGNEPIHPGAGSIHGTKWSDLNGNGQRDDDEPGLAGITIYVDLNNNGRFDSDEPHAVTMEDFNDDLVDDTGKYWLEDLPAGRHIVREVVPDGFEQTFPAARGARIVESVSVRREPERASGFELVGVEQVVSANGTLGTNLIFSVTWSNACGLIDGSHRIDDAGRIHVEMSVGDNPLADCGGEEVTEMVHTIHVGPLANGSHDVRAELHEFENERIAFVAEARFLIGGNGQHVVTLERGEVVEGIDFGNQPTHTELGSLHGRKWADRNGNGQQDPGERGLPGVIIWLDVNLNGQLDEGERRTRTMQDDPDTDRDEAGMYWFDRLEAGFYVVHEVVPDGFEPTYPGPFLCRAIFCTGHGHMVNLEPGATVDGLDFGNQPIEPDTGTIAGLKWLDRNGNGARDADEPGLPGVTVYLDLNNNSILDRGEPHTETRFDDPTTRWNEAGRYRLENVRADDYRVREVVPEGFVQTFPRTGMGQVIDSISIARNPLAVTDFDLVTVGESITADGTVGIGLTYSIHHGPELCAPIIESGARVDEAGRIHVEMSARPALDALCINEPMETSHTVTVAGFTGDRMEVRAELFEQFGDGEQLSFVNEALVEFGHGDGGHVVLVEPGQLSGGVDFGNRRVGGAPSHAIWDGEAAVGQPGDGANWEDPQNWSVDGEPDRMPTGDDQTEAGSHVILAPGAAETIHVGSRHTVNSLRFMDDYRLVGNPITITTGSIQVDAGVVGTLNLGVIGPVIKSGPGTLILAGEAGDVTVSAGVLGGTASLGHLQVGPSATVAPGTSAGVLEVASASFEPNSTLAIEIGGVDAGQYDTVVSEGTITIEGNLAVELLEGFDGLLPGETASITILRSGAIQGRFSNDAGWNHLDQGLFYQLNYDATSVEIDLRQALPADANGDGIVDAADIGIWSDNRFTHGDWRQGDFNHDHAIDGSDFDIWLDHRFERVARETLPRTARLPRAAASAVVGRPAVTPETPAIDDLDVQSSSAFTMTSAQRDFAQNQSQRGELGFDSPELQKSQFWTADYAKRHNQRKRINDVHDVDSTRLDGDWADDVDGVFAEVGDR